MSWIVGLALLGAVIGVALQLADVQELERLVGTAEPWWLGVAVALQLATYVAASQVFRGVARASGHSLGLARACELGLVKLFVDKTVPSAGLSGTAVLADGLERAGLPRPTVAASVVIDLVSYHGAYALCLTLALVIAALRGEVEPLVLLVALVVCAGGIGISVVALAGQAVDIVPRRLSRLRPVRAVIEFVQQADPQLTRRPSLLLRASTWQFAIVLLDAATLWILVLSLGSHGSPSGVFASFMISSLLRTFVPLGLGSFEAVSVVTLHMVGIPTVTALTATLLFRALSLWLPMLPGLWLARRIVARAAVPSPFEPEAYWATAPGELMRRLASSERGLSSASAAEHLRRFGRNELQRKHGFSRARVLWNQVKSPLLLLLLFAALVSALTRAWPDAAIVSTIVLATVIVGYVREAGAQTAIAALAERVQTRVQVLRDDLPTQVPIEEVVPGDVVLLAAGSIVPADAVVFEATDCHVSEAVLTGESFPVEKAPGIAPPHAPVRERDNCVFQGTNVRSGTARCLVVAIGAATELGAIAHRLRLRPPDTELDKGVRRFGYLLTSAMLTMVLLVFVAHVLSGRPPVETLLFAIALAVGLSPELLPAILTINLARGARHMARHGVVVRHLNAIENLGSMDVLCTDKTGTLTEGVVTLDGAYDASGAPAEAVLDLGAVNAALETGLPSPLDDAILAARRPDVTRLRKLAEIPFDFVRKRVSVVVADAQGAELITKGAVDHVLDACTRMPDGSPLDSGQRAALRRLHETWSGRGNRVLAVAQRRLPAQDTYRRGDEHDLTLAGFLTFSDRPKAGVTEAIGALAKLGVSVKLITGDSGLVARHVAGLVGLPVARVMTGAELDALHDEALWRLAETTDLFVEVDPNQKERILLALKKMGHVVGFLGDGVNDAPAMHAADTSLSVEGAVDVARAAADFVLLERDLDVIRRGIEEGRRTFANTLKYVLATTSANLGNMASMAVASLFLPFLPLTAGQILLNNFLSDVPAFGIAADSVDSELVDRPGRWSMRFIGRFMVEFGLLSSLFDLLTFAALLELFGATPESFRTGWFVESLLTELLVMLVVRTQRPFHRSRPGKLLLLSTSILIVVTFAIPYVPHAAVLGFVPLPFGLLALLAAIAACYVLAAELTKAWFYRTGCVSG